MHTVKYTQLRCFVSRVIGNYEGLSSSYVETMLRAKDDEESHEYRGTFVSYGQVKEDARAIKVFR